VLWAEAGPEATYEFVRRLVFSVITGNGHMHLKNWSLLYADGRTPALSPAYDLVATLPYIPGDTLALSFGGSRSLSMITLDQVRQFADQARLPGGPVWRIVQETRERTREAWKTLPEKDLIPAGTRKVIERRIQTSTS
jgi:serine/threonine-protein kinase HipA